MQSRSFPSCLRNRHGATMVEFALVAPIFFLLIFAIIEFGLIQFSRVALESATAQVARDATLGRTSDEDCPGASDQVEYVRCIFKQKTLGLVNSDKIYVTAAIVNGGSSGGVDFNPDVCMTNPPSVGVDCPEGVGYEEVNGTLGYQSEPSPASVGNAGDMIEVKVFYPWKTLIPFMDRFFGGKNSSSGADNGVILLTSSTVVKNEPYND